ncbi:hypothetical protein [Aquifex aeolicus]|uniref:Uncharacterized protein aq_1428 n=1 Tax=Aquifex aeolicus (strain VF5) TaxID=224324 RepID=Y1428_AQUAE|nr:hypothetical protein [Aquifex aeolicus]O67421.1 RecName: Full=Uncharacterized protein aq_1428 [Aquifex aeolicus VF5]AAC07391.1 putative protein [Aquifex aeolicus VF5]
MLRFEDWELAVVIILTRFMEAIAIIISIYLAFNGYKLRYVLATAGVFLLSVLINLTGLIFRPYFIYFSLASIFLSALILTALILYVKKNPEKTKSFSLPENARCPVCNVLILKEDELCTAKIGNYTYYFDTCHHLVQLLKEPDYFVERGNIFKGELKEVFVKTKDTKKWKKFSEVKLVGEDGRLVAYENPPKGAKVINPEEILRESPLS